MAVPAVRLRDVAAATGVSVNTVSLALRGSGLVAPQTREMVAEAASRLGYRPNAIAKSLVSRRTMTVGLILTNITNPILTEVAQAAEAAFMARGYSTVFATTGFEPEQERRALDLLTGRQVDGILIYPTHHRQLAHILAAATRGVPVVLLAGEDHRGLDAVRLDEAQGAMQAIRHLLALGHRRIGMLDSGTPHGNLEKLEGYRRALAEAGIAYDEQSVVCLSGASPKAGAMAMATLMRRQAPPTAVFASTDSQAIGAMDWCRSNGLGVPDDVSVVGFDNIELSPYANPPLTTITYDATYLADRAAERLFALIDATVRPTPATLLVAPRLELRHSTARPRAPQRA